jgi:Protein of unknown function (DUF4229)
MAESTPSTPAESAASAPSESASKPGGPDGRPASPPKVVPWLLFYTFDRIAIAVILVLVLWWAGVGSYAGLLFGVLLSMPVSYLALRPVRDRLTEALAARSVARRTAKEDLRTRLSGSETDED